MADLIITEFFWANLSRNQSSRRLKRMHPTKKKKSGGRIGWDSRNTSAMIVLSRYICMITMAAVRKLMVAIPGQKPGTSIASLNRRRLVWPYVPVFFWGSEMLTCTGSSGMLLFSWYGITADAFAEHVVAPALVGQHDGHKKEGNDRHDFQCHLAG